MKTFGILLALISVSIAFGESDITQIEHAEKGPANLIWFHQETLPTDVSVLEGLPHPRWEPYARAHQIETKGTINLGREIYYERSLKVSEADIAALCLAAQSAGYFFTLNGGQRLCGGFHGDYCVIWKFKDSIVAQLHICFGCNEAIFCRGEERCVVDLSPDARACFKVVLTKYRDQRPEYEEPKSLEEMLRKNIEYSVPTRIDIDPKQVNISPEPALSTVP